MKQLIRISNKLFAEPWCIKDSVRKNIVTQFKNYLAQDDLPPIKEQASEDGFMPDDMRAEDESDQPPFLLFDNGRIALVSIEGVLGKKLSLLETSCGGCDVDHISATLDTISEDDGIETLILHVDSPGGNVNGIPELATQIKALAQSMRVIAYCDTVGASAAYWLMSQCDAIYVSRSAEIGSVGVYLSILHDPEESANVTLIKDGKYKALDEKPLDVDGQAYLQAQVASLGTMFRGDIKSMRPDIDDTNLQGQTFIGKQSVLADLSDGIYNSVVDLIDDLSTDEDEDDEVDNNE